jgi:hypothetical protein
MNCTLEQAAEQMKMQDCKIYVCVTVCVVCVVPYSDKNCITGKQSKQENKQGGKRERAEKRLGSGQRRGNVGV